MPGRIVLLAPGEMEVASWPLPDRDPADLAVADELARLQLSAKRLGCSIRLEDACPRLTALLDLAGLAGAIPSLTGRWPEPASVEVGGEPEGGEEVGVEEGVELGDPTV